MKRKAPPFKAVILAGGSGERFWPLSTAKRPKQFLRVFGGESLIRQCAKRLEALSALEDVYVVTSKELLKMTRRELSELPPENIIGEPMRRDTAAAIALGVSSALSNSRAGEDPVIGFFIDKTKDDIGGEISWTNTNASKSY